MASKILPLRLLGDTDHTLEVINWAECEDLLVRRPSPHHIKIGPWNYYPTKRTSNCDFFPAEKHSGYSFFQEAVRRWKAEVDLIDSL